jgi:uncharacterized membrane protein
MYEFLKTIHVIGTVLLIGNVTVTAVWKVFADRTRNAPVIAFAQGLVTITDFGLTCSGIVLIMIGGYGAAYLTGQHPFGTSWLILGQMLFAASGAIWVLILIPIQIRQARSVRAFTATGGVPEQYWQDCRRWLFWGIVATLPLVASVFVMVAKI